MHMQGSTFYFTRSAICAHVSQYLGCLSLSHAHAHIEPVSIDALGLFDEEELQG